MNATKAQREATDSQDLCTIVVLYDNNAHRRRALAACDSLVRQLWREVELKFHWWRTDFLLDPQLAQLAADNAAAADILVMCTEQTPVSMPALESWLEKWLDRRGETAGALINLLPVVGPSARADAQEKLLQEICRRGGFDYLATATVGKAAVHSPHSPRESASVHSRPPSRHGLNE